MSIPKPSDPGNPPKSKPPFGKPPKGKQMDKLIKKDKRKMDKMMDDLVKKDIPRDKKIEKCDKEMKRGRAKRK